MLWADGNTYPNSGQIRYTGREEYVSPSHVTKEKPKTAKGLLLRNCLTENSEK